ncbi:MAG TPA: hypothetical protein VMH04_20050 [Candidatus Solibacter sp.]|nr:hypothetical protein [Candidatus Solibacter sp.]
MLPFALEPEGVLELEEPGVEELVEPGVVEFGVEELELPLLAVAGTHGPCGLVVFAGFIPEFPGVPGVLVVAPGFVPLGVVPFDETPGVAVCGVVVELVPPDCGVAVVFCPVGVVPGVAVGGGVPGVELCPACPAGAEPAGELCATTQPAHPSTSDNIAIFRFIENLAF